MYDFCFLTYDKLVRKATKVSKHSKASVRMCKWQRRYYINISTHLCFRSLFVSSSKAAGSLFSSLFS